ncbi:MAG: DUF2971 domain-containing protein [Ramlibacter sp.]|nr:DUF2971 domain-containing protein [Ramlibacter sp.]
MYYLTSAQFALSNIALRRVKISRFSDLNDPFELLAVDLKERGHRRIFRETRDKLNEGNGLICMSRSWANPLMWGHYGDRHLGIALGFEVADHVPSPVIYAKTPAKIPIDKATNKPILDPDLVNRLLRTKFHDWKYENEMRIFVELDPKTRESGLYFFDFSADFGLREVILGPRCELPISRVRAMVENFDPDVTVIKSRIAFSSFRVIKNKAASK